jgi:V-type H+-transporting ATPase subunit a
MILGVLMKGVNNIHTRSGLDFFFEFLPQLIFLLSTFGYMVFLIIIKWLTDYTHNTSQAPSILTTFLNMALKSGSTEGKNLY